MVSFTVLSFNVKLKAEDNLEQTTLLRLYNQPLYKGTAATLNNDHLREMISTIENTYENSQTLYKGQV